MSFMPRLLSVVLLVLTLPAFVTENSRGAETIPAGASASLADIYIADRTDGERGSGTPLNPYDGSTEARFDALIGSLVTKNCTIHLGPGTFQTKGITLAPLSSLIGAGLDRTIVQLAPDSAVYSGAKQWIIRHGGNNPSGVATGLVSDLTVDGNIDRQYATRQSQLDICLCGIGETPIVQRVKLINLGTTLQNTNNESFWILANVIGNQKIPTCGLLVEDCTCIAPTRPMYVSFIAITGANLNPEGPETIAATNALIRHCNIITSTPTGTFVGHGYGFANCKIGVLEDCYCDGIDRPFYQDTWSNRKMVIRNNVFTRCLSAVFLNGPGGGSYEDGLDIDNNTFELTSHRFENAIYLYHSALNFVRIERNRIRLDPFTSTDDNTDGGIQIQSMGQATAQVRYNCIDLPNVSRRIFNPAAFNQQASVVDFEDNYDSYGENIVGRRNSRATFVVPSAGWYNIWVPLNGASEASGLIGLNTKPVLAGKIVLEAGTTTVVDPSITGKSRVVFKFVSPGGTPGLVHSVITAGTGFTLTSSNAGDASTYSYTVDSGGEGSSVLFSAQVSSSSTVRPSLTQIYADHPAAAGEADCSQVRAYGTKVGCGVVQGYFTGPALVTVDFTSNMPYGYWENIRTQPGTHWEDLGNSLVSTLKFDAEQSSKTTGTVMAGGLDVTSGSGLSGTVTLSGGSGTITSPQIDEGTVILLTLKTENGAPGTASPLTKVAAGSATISGLSTDNSTYNWVAIKTN